MISKGNFEDISQQIERDSYSLKIRGLRKVYNNSKVAVDGVSMTMFSIYCSAHGVKRHQVIQQSQLKKLLAGETSSKQPSSC